MKTIRPEQMEQLRAAMPALLLPHVVLLGNMYDVIMPSYISGCPNGCAPWASAGSAAYPQKTIKQKAAHVAL